MKDSSPGHENQCHVTDVRAPTHTHTHTHTCRNVKTSDPTWRQIRNVWYLSGFRGGHDAGYTGLAATTWVPMRAQVPVLSPNNHPNPSQGRQQGFDKSRKLKTFSGDTKQPYQSENGKVLWQGPIGGADQGYPEFGSETPTMG